MIIAPAGGAIALLFTLHLISRVKTPDPGSAQMLEIADMIHEGAMAFLKRQYIPLTTLTVIILLALGLLLGNWGTAGCFLVGAGFAALADFIGLNMAAKANIRTASAARASAGEALTVAFSGGSVMGMAISGLSLIGLGVLYNLFQDPAAVSGFALGVGSVALLGRVSGGVYARATGAGLADKLKAAVSEDDPRDPVTIIDNIGGLVGGVAGMGADLSAAYASSIAAAMTIGAAVLANDAVRGTFLPFAVAACGVAASVIGTLFIRPKDTTNPMRALSAGFLRIILIITFLVFFAVMILLPNNLIVFFAVLDGLAAGILIGLITQYYTGASHKPAQKVAAAARTASASAVISGLALGMFSTALPVIVICAAAAVAFAIGGLYGVAVASVGMLAATGVMAAIGVFAPIAAGADGIANMVQLPRKVRGATGRIAAAGSVTAAVGQGFAIGASALTALVLLVAYAQAADLQMIDMLQPIVVVGLLLGGMLPFAFCALTLNAAGRAAREMAAAVDKQLRHIAESPRSKVKADRIISAAVSTKSALREMILSSVIAVAIPIAVGTLLGREALGAMLAGSIVTGVCLAVMLTSAGGAWGGVQKHIDGGALDNKSAARAAAAVGGIVGAPCQDISAPALNILIKLMGAVALVFAPLFM